MLNIQSKRQLQGGNVLFLILIAVALFAALSYVVTQSTRSGGGSTEREKNILSSAQMTQYPTALRTSIIRMVLAGVSIENVKFDAPGSTAFNTTSAATLVFHPQGGGATYQQAPADLSTGSSALTWSYNANFYVPGIGIDTSGGNDVIAFLPGVSSGVCKQVNEQLGIDLTACTPLTSGVPQSQASVTSTLVTATDDSTYTFPTGPGALLQCMGATATSGGFLRQASGCFFDSTATPSPGKYTFYSVLLER